MGIPLKDLINKYASGSNRWLGKFTGCYSWRILNAFITKKICETITMDFDSLIENKSGLGTRSRYCGNQ